ncbi:hypothetical protein [Micromonospora sp. RTGN7]|uniref:hypothetical protein n=1 Tax=Micromonospora sp. RTGN7 TaxID=3016526 RepID=UPI0029FF485B|nr:hypothetical protein [Micromonospora sp. RTGN7]
MPFVRPRVGLKPPAPSPQVEDLFNTMSREGRKDEVTKDFEYTREYAEVLTIASAGMLKRLSAEHSVVV